MIGKSDSSFGLAGLKGLAALFDSGASARRIATRLLTTSPDQETRERLDTLRDAKDAVTRVRQENDPAKLRREAAERKIQEAKQKLRQLRMFGGLTPKALARAVQRVLKDLAQAIGAYTKATEELGDGAAAGRSVVTDAQAAARSAEVEARAAATDEPARQPNERNNPPGPEAAVRAYAENEQREFANRDRVFKNRLDDREVWDEARRVVEEAKRLLEQARRRRKAPEEALNDRDAVVGAEAALRRMAGVLGGRPIPAVPTPTSFSV